MDLVLNVRFLRNFRHTGGLATCLLHRYPKRTSLCCVELYLGVNKEIAVNKLSTDFHIMFLSESQSKLNYNGLIPPSLHCCHTENLRKFNVYAHIYLHKYNCTWATAVARLQVEVWEVQLSVQIEVLLMDRGIYGARLYVESDQASTHSSPQELDTLESSCTAHEWFEFHPLLWSAQKRTQNCTCNPYVNEVEVLHAM